MISNKVMSVEDIVYAPVKRTDELEDELEDEDDMLSEEETRRLMSHRFSGGWKSAEEAMNDPELFKKVDEIVADVWGEQEDTEI